MSAFRTAIRLESHLRRGVFADLPSVLVDTGSEATWVPREQLEALGITPGKRVSERSSGEQQMKDEADRGTDYKDREKSRDVPQHVKGSWGTRTPSGTLRGGRSRTGINSIVAERLVKVTPLIRKIKAF